MESVIGAQWKPGLPVLPCLIWKGHMTLLEAPSQVNWDALFQEEGHVATPTLGFSFYYHTRHDQPRTAPGVIYCRLCKPTRKAGEFPRPVRRHSCLAEVAFCAGGSGHPELLRCLRGAGADGRGLVLQEVFAGTGGLTAEWKRHGEALEPVEIFEDPHLKRGYKPDHDVQCPEVRQRLIQGAQSGKANVHWLASPCTSYCDWQLSNGGSRTFELPQGSGTGPLAATESLGNELSEFSAEYFLTALENDAFPVAESSGVSGRYPKQWDLPCWQPILARPDVDVVDFPMCAFGLGPPDQPDARYIHQTRVVFPKHPPLRRALSRLCPGVSPQHRHTPLKGSRDGSQVTRCTEAGAYAKEFIQVVVTVLQSTLGGVGFHPRALLEANEPMKKGSTNSMGNREKVISEVKVIINIGENLEVTINIEENLEVTINIKENLEVIINIGEDLEVIINIGRNLEVTFNIGKNLEVTINTTENWEVIINFEENLEVIPSMIQKGVTDNLKKHKEVRSCNEKILQVTSNGQEKFEVIIHTTILVASGGNRTKLGQGISSMIGIKIQEVRADTKINEMGGRMTQPRGRW